MQISADLHLGRGVEQTRVVAQLLQRGDAGQVCVGLRGALKAVSEDSVGEKLRVQLPLQRARFAEQRPIESWRQVAVDDFLCPSQDEHAGQARELRGPLLSQNALLLWAGTGYRITPGKKELTYKLRHREAGRQVALPPSRRVAWSAELAPRRLFCTQWTTRGSPGSQTLL